ncbi:MAG: hypothetical protein ACC657_07260 [Thiohalomonadales bacterium]
MNKIRILLLFAIFAFNSNLNAQNLSEIRSLVTQKNYSRALIVIDQKLINGTNNQELLYLKALSESQLNQVNPAIKTYQLLIKLYPLFPEAYNNLAGLFAKQGKLEIAKKILEKGINTSKTYALLHKNINSIYLEMARESYVKALQLGVKKHNVELSLASFNQPSTASKTVVAVSNSKNSKNSKNSEIKNRLLSPESINPGKTSINPKKIEQRITKKKVVIKAWSEPVISVKDEVITALQGWAAAWSAQDVELYLSFYNKQFIPENGTPRQIWVTQRQSRLLKPRWIEVRLSNFLFEQQEDDQAEVKVTQMYRSDSFQDKSKKKFLLKRSEDGWQILNESNFQE